MYREISQQLENRFKASTVYICAYLCLYTYHIHMYELKIATDLDLLDIIILLFYHSDIFLH